MFNTCIIKRDIERVKCRAGALLELRDRVELQRILARPIVSRSLHHSAQLSASFARIHAQNISKFLKSQSFLEKKNYSGFGRCFGRVLRSSLSSSRCMAFLQEGFA